MKNVLVITPFIWEGGPWRGKRTVYAILEGFQRWGYQVHVITATNRPHLREDTWQGLHIHYVHPQLTPNAPAFDAFHSFLTQISQDQHAWRRHLTFRLFWLNFVWGAARRASQVAQEHPPRFLYGVNNPGIPPAWYVARSRRVPFFARIMGSPLLQWKASRLKLYLARFDELLAFKLPARALIITDDSTISATAIHKQLGISQERIWMFRNGIDKEMFLQPVKRGEIRKALGISPDALVILWVSQLVNWKHPERLLHAMPQVLSRVPRAQVMILGDGPQRPHLEALARRLGIAQAVRFTGFVERSNLPGYFHAADVFTAFYDYGNIGNSTLEAMLCGLPVVALDAGHTAEVIHHGENGWLVPSPQPGIVADALITILQNDALRKEMGEQAARQADATLLTWEERIDQEISRIEAALS